MAKRGRESKFFKDRKKLTYIPPYIYITTKGSSNTPVGLQYNNLFFDLKRKKTPDN